MSSTIRCTVILYTTKKGKNTQERLIKRPPHTHMKLGPQKPAPSVRRETRKEIVPQRKGPEGSLNVSALVLSEGGEEHLP